MSAMSMATTARGRRRATPFAVALALALACLVSPRPAAAIPDSAVCNEKDQPILVAEQQCAWWKRQRDDVRASTNCCLPILKKVKQLQTQAYNHHLKSIDTKLSQEQRRKHHQKANELFEKRGVQAELFKDCVNKIKVALDKEKQKSLDPRGAITGACGGPVDFIENLGWRRCVDLDASTLVVDHLMSLTQHDYNCHYYTKSFVQTALGVLWTPPDAGSWNDCIGKNGRPGWAVNPGEAHVGDLVLVKGPDALPCPYHHSGVIIQVNPDGTPKRIRQKDGPNTCVVDLDWDEFQRVWVNRPNIKSILYSNPDHRGDLPRWEP
jgi:hypothetical protein